MPDTPEARDVEQFANFFMNDTENLKRFNPEFDLVQPDNPEQKQLDEVLNRPTTSAIGKHSEMRRPQGFPLKKKNTRIDQEMIV